MFIFNRSMKTNSNNGVILRGHDHYWVDLGTLDSAVRLKPRREKGEHLGVFVHCNGLLALTNQYGDITFWNPSTRRYGALAMFKRKSPFLFGLFEPIIMGFGYDPIKDDYKVWRRVKSLGVGVDSCQIYSLKANSWKTIFSIIYIQAPQIWDPLEWFFRRTNNSRSQQRRKIIYYNRRCQ